MATPTYLTFDLLIEPWQSNYRARVLSSPAGQAAVDFTLPFTAETLTEIHHKQQITPRQIKAIGKELFKAVFQGGVDRCLARSLEIARHKNTGLRIRLRLNNEAPLLAALPWEYLYDPNHEQFLALSDQTPIVRYLETDETDSPLSVALPLRMLVILSDPSDLLPRLDVNAEWERLQAAFQDLQQEGLVVLERLSTATLSVLQTQLQQNAYHIIHFIGHGVFDQEVENSGLLLENRQGQTQIVPTEAFVTLLRDHRSLRLVFLNACEGGRNGEHNIFAGVAQRLVQQGLPAVIAMQCVVTDRAATYLAQSFYHALTIGYPVDAALSEARKTLFTQESSAEWATPILLMRAPDGYLFDLNGSNSKVLLQSLGVSPFKGLQYFDVDDADLFFGRELLTADLVKHLAPTPAQNQTVGNRFLAVIGASGSGKSSLVRAGLVPTLQRGQPLPGKVSPPKGSDHWLIHILTPTANPLENLATLLTQENDSVRATATLLDDLLNDPRTLHLYVRKLLATSSRSKGTDPTAPKPERLLLVVDQFEEIFTLCRDRVERKAFIDNLLYAAGIHFGTTSPDAKNQEEWRSGPGPAIVVITLRADFYAHCAEYDNLRAALERYQKYIGPMNPDELKRAIEEPARRHQWEFEPGLVELILDDVGIEPGALPLLSHALLETWKHREGRTLTYEGYTKAGRVQGAIAKTADQLFTEELTPDQQNIARNIFLRLTELGEGVQDTRRRVTLDELLPHSEKRQAVESVLTALADARLVTTDKGSAEVAHEALIREWPQLREWLSDNREGLRVHRRLTEAAREWQTLTHDPGALLRGVRLDQTLQWAAEHTDELNELEQEYLATCRRERELEQQEQEAQRRREIEHAQELANEQKMRAEEQTRAASHLKRRNLLLRVASGAALLLALAAATFGVQANYNYQLLATREADLQIALTDAETAKNSAKLSERLAQQEAENARLEKERADSAAYNARQQEQVARRQERIAQAGFRVGQGLLADTVQKDRAESRPLLLAREAVLTTWITDTAIITHPFVTMEADRALRNALDNESPWQWILPAHRHTKPIWGVAFSPDGKTVVTAGDDQTAGIWDVTTGRQVARLIGHHHIVRSADFSPDGQTVITASPDGTARLWDARTGVPIGVLVGKGTAETAAFSPDGRLIATGGAALEIHLWDAQTQQEIGQLTGHTGWVSSVAFSSDGKLLVSGSDDKTIRLWDLSSGKTLRVLEGSTDQVYTVTFSPDNTQVASGGRDRNMRLWDVATGQEIRTFEGHKRTVRDVAFSHDGTLLASASEDRTAIIWKRATGEIKQTMQSYSGVHGAKFSPDDQTLVTADSNYAVRFWSVDSGQELRHLEGHILELTAVAYSPTGDLIATAGKDQTIHLWNAQQGTEIGVLRGITSEVYATSFSPDNQWLASGAEDGSVQLWDVASGQIVTRMIGHSAAVQAVVFSPDSKWLASASVDQTIRLWSIASGEETQRFTGHTDAILSIAFSPDGKRLVSVSHDDTLRLWEVATGQEVRQWQGPTGGLMAVAFSPDGKTVATGGSDQTLRVWDIERGAEVRTLIGHEGAIRSVAFSVDGRNLLTASEDWSARLWDITTQSTIHRYDGHSGPVTAAIFSADGKRIVTVSDDRTARVWAITPQRPVTVFSGHTSDVNWAVFSPDGKTIASASTDETVRLWEVATGKILWQQIASDEGEDDYEIGGVTFSPDGTLLASASEDSKARLWDVATGAELRSFVGHEKEVVGANFSPDGTRLVTASEDNTARVWDVQTGKELGKLEGHQHQVRAATFSPDGKMIATASYDWTAKLWDATTYEEIRTFDKHTFQLIYVMFSKDGKRLLTAGDDRTARIWDVATGQELQQFAHIGEVKTAVFSPDERYIVTACEDNSVNLWDVTTGVNLRRIEDHPEEANSAFFSPDGKWFLSTSDDRTIRLWLASVDELLQQADQRIQRDPPILVAPVAR